MTLPLASNGYSQSATDFANHLLANRSDLDDDAARSLAQKIPGAISSVAAPVKWTAHAARGVPGGVIIGSARFIEAVSLSFSSQNPIRRRLKQIDALLDKPGTKALTPEQRSDIRFYCLHNQEHFDRLRHLNTNEPNVSQRTSPQGAVRAALAVTASVSAATGGPNLSLGLAEDCKKLSELYLHDLVNRLPDVCVGTEDRKGNVKSFCLRHPEVAALMEALPENITSQITRHQTQPAEVQTEDGPAIELQVMGASRDGEIQHLITQTQSVIANAIHAIETLSKGDPAYQQTFVQRRIFHSLISAEDTGTAQKLLQQMQQDDTENVEGRGVHEMLLHPVVDKRWA